MSITVYLHPEPKKAGAFTGGVDHVVAKMHALLPSTGITLVSARRGCDVVAAHIIGPTDEPLDVLHCHGLYPTAQGNLENWTWEVNARVIAAARGARRVTVPSPWVAELFQRDMGFTPEIIPHGIDLKDWPQGRPKDLHRRNVLWNKNRSGDVCDPRPVNVLAKAAPGWTFYTTFGVPTNNVQVSGVLPHSEMRSTLYETGGVYFASTKETFGIGILEAMAVGLPVLAYDWGNAPSLVQHQVNGYLVAPGDIDAAKLGLEYIDDHYEELSQAARATAEHYDWLPIMQRYADVYLSAFQESQEEPLISVVIPCHNYARYVGEAIRSVRAQEGVAWELLVVDDGSTDDFEEAVRQASGDDPRVRVLRGGNTGVAGARNRGARAARGQFLCFLDADDVLLPGALRTLYNGIKSDRRLGIAYGKLGLISAEGEVLQNSSAWPNAFDPLEQLRRHNQIPSCCLIRRTAFERAGGFRQRTAPCEDAELWTRIILQGFEAKLVTSKVVYHYRLHDQAATAPIREGKAKEPNWLHWIAAANGGPHPFASVTPSVNLSHPVYDYDTPLLSFVIPVGPKHVGTLADALASVEAQTDPRWEVIVVDDTEGGNLADAPLPEAFTYRERHPYARWLRNEVHGNVSAARNLGARAARGKYLCFLDADDVLLPDFAKRTLAISLECQGDGAVVYTDWVALPEGKDCRAENWHLPRLLDHALFAVTFVHPKAAFEQVNGFDESLDLWEDWDYTIRLALQGYKGIRIPVPLFAYRYDTGQRREASLARAEELRLQIRGKYASAIPKPRRG